MTEAPVEDLDAARSAQAAQYLHGAGIDPQPVAGGTSAWARSGRPFETGAPRR